MQWQQESKTTNGITAWISDNKGVFFSSSFGIIFGLVALLTHLGYAQTSSPVLILMQTVLLLILFVGMMVFVYNFGYVVIMLAIDEGLNEEERLLLKWVIRRAAIISVLWFVGVLLLIAFIDEIFMLASLNCFLLTLLFFFIRKGENPLTEGTSI